jgi:hypothetical protein
MSVIKIPLSLTGYYHAYKVKGNTTGRNDRVEHKILLVPLKVSAVCIILSLTPIYSKSNLSSIVLCYYLSLSSIATKQSPLKTVNLA